MAKKKKQALTPEKLKLLVTVVNRSKAEYFLDVLDDYEINLQMVLYGSGTATSDIINMLGAIESDKAVILSFTKESKSKEILQALKEKFQKGRNGTGISFLVPMDSIIGLSIYQMLSNQKRSELDGNMR